ncbi:hypothetical protein ID866_9739 [Astraeus odoratus]|nr:hypothetical protein ID866_9739 [Astraeus odoratus]
MASMSVGEWVNLCQVDGCAMGIWAHNATQESTWATA